MLLNNSNLLEEFYEKIHKDYPELSYEKVRNICIAPWQFLRSIMLSGTLETVRLKYFGTFRVYPKKVAMSRKKNLERFQEGKMSKKDYDYYESMFKNYLSRNDK